MSELPRLDALRKEIESVTLSIIGLVGQRNALAHAVALEKAQHELSLVNPAVEKHLRDIVVDKCNAVGVEPGLGLRLLNQLIDESIRIQRKTVGPEPSYDGHKIFTIAKEMEQSGQRVIHLEVGEPDFGPPAAVVSAMAEAVAHGFTHYTQSVGIPVLRQRIAKALSESYRREISPQEVIITASGKYALYLAITSTLQAGDEAIIIDPSFPAYSSFVREVGARAVRISTEFQDDWRPDTNAVQESINRSTRLIILNSPCNPTGKVLDEHTCRALADLAKENNIRILSDEVYSSFSCTPYTSLLQMPECSQVIVKSFSKHYGMTGFRLGYAVADPVTIKRMAGIQYNHLTSAPEFIQYAGLAALDCEDEVLRNAATIKSRLQLASSLLELLPVSYRPADGGFYIFVRLEGREMDGVEFAERLLSEKGVCVTPGIVYGSQYGSFFRISVCQPEDRLRDALARMEEFLR